MKINLNKVWKLNNNQYPLFGTANTLAEFPFMSEYITNHNSLDRNLALTRGYMIPIWNVEEAESENGVVTQFRSDATDVIRKHKVDLQHLWDITQIEYDPIENYSMTEEGTDKTDGTNDVTRNYGEQNKTNVSGAQMETVSRDARTITDIDAAATDTEEIGAKTSSTEDKVSAYDSDDYQDSDLSETSEGEQSNTNQYGERNRTHTENAYEDVTSRDAVTNTEAVDSHVDTENGEESRTTEHSLTRSGNIGVTTTQQMAQSEIELWSGFNFYNKLFDIILEELCYFADDGDAPLLTPVQNIIF
ncbi:MAG: hypothetical protein U0K91_02415 [Acutalibacteraceae bacterium]|nr:hypothetical protein [Acutalibacteraceae bacterium]